MHDLATSQERERQVTAELREMEQTVTDLRAVNDVLRAQLAEALAESSRWAQRCGEAESDARGLREGRATWVTHDDGTRQLVSRRVVVEQAGLVEPEQGGHVRWAVNHAGALAEGSCDVRSSSDAEQAMCRAQRIVEALIGVKP